MCGATKTEGTAEPPAASKSKQHAHAPKGDGFDHGRPKPSTSGGLQMTPTLKLRG